MPEGRTRSGGTAPDAIERITDGTQTNRASRRFSTAQDRPSFNAVPHETRPAQTRQHICNSSHRHLANKNMKRTFLWAALLLNGTAPALACTGISFTARDGAFVTARTIEWARAAAPAAMSSFPGSTKPSHTRLPEPTVCRSAQIRGGRTDDRPGRIHRRGNQRSRDCRPDCSTSPITANTRPTIRPGTTGRSRISSMSRGYSRNSPP